MNTRVRSITVDFLLNIRIDKKAVNRFQTVVGKSCFPIRNYSNMTVCPGIELQRFGTLSAP